MKESSSEIKKISTNDSNNSEKSQYRDYAFVSQPMFFVFIAAEIHLQVEHVLFAIL